MFFCIEILGAKSVGFTISEIVQLLDAWYNNKMTISEKLGVLEEKLLSIDKRIQQLQEMKKMISKFKNDVIEDDC